MNIEEIISQLSGLKEHCHSMIDKEEPESIWKGDEEALQFAIDLLSGKGENLLALLKLMQENPELPGVPMVDGEIPGDDSGYWLGAWGSVKVDEYLLTNNREWMVFKSDDDVFDVLEKYLSDDEFEKLPETEEECRPVYNALPWTKAIIVYIQTSD